ncbi:SMI1/KNR4 family protein [Spirillospora sp. CA-108201]
MSDKINTEIAAVLDVVATTIAEAAPEGWTTARLRGSVDRNDNVSTVPAYDGTAASNTPDVSASLAQVYRLMGMYPGTMLLTLECSADGAYRAQIGDAEERPTIHRSHDVGQYRDRGDEQDGPADPAPAGDPDEAVRLFHAYLQRRAEVIGEAEDLPEAATEEEIEGTVSWLEENTGYTLPPDLRALYGICNGDGGFGLFDGYDWADIEHCADLADGDGGIADWTEIARDWIYEPHKTLIRDSDPAGAVKRSIMRPGWIPFADDTGGNFLAVDMDPGPTGRPGQVIAIGTDHSSGAVYLADSVTGLLRRLVEALDDADCEDGHLVYETGLPDHMDAERAARGYASDADPCTPQPLVQIFRASVVDGLAFVRSAPNLHALRLETETEPDLAPLTNLPLETLELDGPSFDLEALRGHPELRALILNTSNLVDLAPLEALPRLWALDIADADVENVETIAGLGNLQFLAVRADQWPRMEHLAPDVVAIKPTAARGSAVRWKTTSARPPRTHSGRIDIEGPGA